MAHPDSKGGVMRIGGLLFGLGLMGAICFGTLVFGQEPSAFGGNKVTPLIKADLTGVSNKQIVANIYEVASGSMVPRHYHHGDEFHLVLSGEWAAEVEGKATRNLKAGDAQYVERERWHGGKVVSDTPMRLLGLMIVDKDKPITEMVRN
jgi:quercetin dioxygenase-like cupin family protein